MKKRLLSALLALCMVLTMVPAAFAVEDTMNDMGTDTTTTADDNSITTAEALKAAIDSASSEDTVTLGGDIEITETLIINNKTITLDLNHHTIKPSDDVDIWKNTEKEKQWSLISIRGSSNVTITGGGTLQAKKNDSYAIDVFDEGSKCTIENGTFVGNVHAVYVLEGSLVVNGGTFSVQQKYNDTFPYEYVLNCYDAHYKDGTASIIVHGVAFA